MMKRAWVYCLRCQNGCFYVGQSTALQTRMCEHFAGQGAQWTTKNPPLSVIEAIECPDGNGLALEAAKTAEYCMRYGWKKVRGAGYTKPDAAGPPPWFDETGERRKRPNKKGERVDHVIEVDWDVSDDALDLEGEGGAAAPEVGKGEA